MKDDLNLCAKLFADWCYSQDIHFSVSWIRCIKNEAAYRLSYFSLLSHGNRQSNRGPVQILIHFPGKTYFGRWNIYPFRLSVTPYLFTKLLKPLLAHWRALGLHIFIYLDDGLALCDCWDEVVWFSHIVHSDLQNLGIHKQGLKCLWDLQTSVLWLGIIIDLLTQTLAYTEDCKERVLKALQACLSATTSMPWLLLGIAGQINSLSLVIGPKPLIDTKIFYRDTLLHIKNRFCWDNHLSFSVVTSSALFAWQTFLSWFCSSCSFAAKGEPVVVYLDASTFGSGAFFMSLRDSNAKVKFHPPEEGPAKDICLRSWSDSEKMLSSTWRDLKIIEEGLQESAKRERGTLLLRQSQMNFSGP